MPILKQSPVSHSKKRPRLDRAMISAPLGDFRHTMHIGRGGDAFGDTSFLSNHGGAKANGLPPEVAVSPGTLSSAGDVSDHFGLLSSPGSGNGLVRSPATSTPDGSFVILGHPEMTEQPSQKPPNRDDWSLPQQLSLESSTLGHAESLLSFQLDLGPSILEDVLGVMDKDWGSIQGQEQETMRRESSSAAEQLHQDAAGEEEEEEKEEEEEEEEGQGYSFEDEQDEEIGL